MEFERLVNAERQIVMMLEVFGRHRGDLTAFDPDIDWDEDDMKVKDSVGCACSEALSMC